eukprot:m.60400 g.60400  ORF g.60400 m.60400 type:complete len:182 (-) comp13083_c0_seq1:683-1228(-)
MQSEGDRAFIYMVALATKDNPSSLILHAVVNAMRQGFVGLPSNRRQRHLRHQPQCWHGDISMHCVALCGLAGRQLNHVACSAAVNVTVDLPESAGTVNEVGEEEGGGEQDGSNDHGNDDGGDNHVNDDGGDGEGGDVGPHKRRRTEPKSLPQPFAKKVPSFVKTGNDKFANIHSPEFVKKK